MSKTRIYLSGPMEGLPNLNAAEFTKAERYYTLRSFEVVNPHRLAAELNAEYAANGKGAPRYSDYLIYSMANLNECDIIVLLPGYKTSGGCFSELGFATNKHIQKPIFMAYTDITFSLHMPHCYVTAYHKLETFGKVADIVSEMPQVHELTA